MHVEPILKAIRENTGISQDVLAERLEVDQSYISRLERRDNITLATKRDRMLDFYVTTVSGICTSTPTTSTPAFELH